MLKSIVGAVLFSFVIMGLPAVMDMDVPYTSVCIGDTPKNVPQYSEVVYEDCQMKGGRHGIHRGSDNSSNSHSRSAAGNRGIHYIRS